MQVKISIHAPRAGGDDRDAIRRGRRKDFNPRPPCGGRHQRDHGPAAETGISIHAPRAGGDLIISQAVTFTADFNPRPPCGGRRRGFCFLRSTPRHFNPRPPCGGRRLQRRFAAMRKRFQSTPPVRGATKNIMEIAILASISIHAPRAGGDPLRLLGPPPPHHFNPRHPCGGRRN